MPPTTTLHIYPNSTCCVRLSRRTLVQGQPPLFWDPPPGSSLFQQELSLSFSDLLHWTVGQGLCVCFFISGSLAGASPRLVPRRCSVSVESVRVFEQICRVKKKKKNHGQVWIPEERQILFKEAYFLPSLPYLQTQFWGWPESSEGLTGTYWHSGPMGQVLWPATMQ